MCLKGSATPDWGTKKQVCVGFSTAEVEIVSQATTTRNMAHGRSVLDFIEYRQETATTIFQHNTSAIIWTQEEKFTSTAKHIDGKYHFRLSRLGWAV